MNNSKFVALVAAVLITLSQIILIGHYTNDGFTPAAAVQTAGDDESI